MEITATIDTYDLMEAVKEEVDFESLVDNALSDADIVSKIEREIRDIATEAAEEAVENSDIVSRLDAIESALHDIAAAAGQF